jgi:hypothetical protein
LHTSACEGRNNMKRAAFICLSQLFAAGLAFSQSTPTPPFTTRPSLVSPMNASLGDPRAQFRMLTQYSNWPLGFEGMSLDASGIFLEAPNYSSGTGNSAAATAADVNGDGKLDLIITNDGVGVLLGNGDGTFQPVVTYGSGGIGVSSVAVADVNGDGKPDLIVGNQCASNCELNGNGVVGVLLGNGDGTFQSVASYYAGGQGAYSLAVGDLNGDGYQDLVIGNGGSVGVLLGNGDGTFQPAVTYSSGGYGFSVALGDLNGDGFLDLVVGAYSGGSVSVLLGGGDGTFQPAVSYGSGGSGSRLSIAVADVNGDGKPDLLAANGCEYGIPDCNAAVLLGNGDGTFQPAQIYPSQAFYGTDSIAAVDVNGDGKVDLLISNSIAARAESYGTVGVFLGKGDGTFAPVQNYAINGGGFPAAVAAADVNGDGKPDLIVSNGNVAVLLGNGRGGFEGARNYSVDLIDDLVAVADADVDGKVYAAAVYCVVSNCTGAARVLLGNGNGTFRTLAPAYATGGSYPASIALSDVNGDGKPDLLVTNGYYNGKESGVGVLLGKGDGAFQPVQTYSSEGIDAGPIAVADVNGDGKPDVLVGNYYDSSGKYSDGNVLVLLGTGDGTFQPSQTYDSGGVGALSLALADVNEDGKLDLIVANDCFSLTVCTNGGVAVLFGNGDGTFQPAVSYNSGGAGTFSVAVGDVNADGKLDLIVANQYAPGYLTSNIAVLLGNGDGTFQSAISTPTPIWGQWAATIVVRDFNGDKKLDVATSEGYLLLGNGDGTFQAPLNIGIPGPAIAIGDFNHDGRPDLLLGDLAVLLNASTGFGFSTETTLVSSPNPSKAGQLVRFTAAVSSSNGTPTGKISFMNDTSVLATKPLNSGTAIFTTSILPPGLNTITAVYGGSSKFAGSTSTPINQSVLAETNTTLSSSPNPSTYGQPVTFTAVVASQSGAPPNGEIVSFMKGKTVLGTGALSDGSASLTTSTLKVGTTSVTAVYGGDSNFAGSKSMALKQVVDKAGK